MAADKGLRKLAAILASDVAGYSRLMANFGWRLARAFDASFGQHAVRFENWSVKIDRPWKRIAG